MATLLIAEDRIRKNTSKKSNIKIDQAIYRAVDHYSESSEREIRKRLKELNEEWDIERVLMLNASVIAVTGTILAKTHSKKWYALPALVAGFLAQHAIQGWCPPLPFFRALGIRTMSEIDAERYALLELLRRRRL